MNKYISAIGCMAIFVVLLYAQVWVLANACYYIAQETINNIGYSYEN